jgi:hypothetical protein
VQQQRGKTIFDFIIFRIDVTRNAFGARDRPMPIAKIKPMAASHKPKKIRRLE